MKGKNLLLILLCILMSGTMVSCGDSPDETSTFEEETRTEEVDETLTEDVTEPEGEEIYQELEVNGNIYRATESGIYCETSAGRECLYSAFPGKEPDMQIFEDILYFKTDTEYQEGNQDWSDCGVRWIDLLTLDSGILELDLGNSTIIEEFRVYNGLVEVRDHGIQLLSEAGKVIFRGKTLSELTEQERAEYGRQVSQRIIENPGRLVNVSNRTSTENIALLDMNMDGTVEEIVLRPQEDADIYRGIDEHEILLNGQRMVQAYGDNVHNSIWALSLDGKEILAAFYEEGPSGDPWTRIFRYENGELVEIGAFGEDINDCEITEDGIMNGMIRRDIIETSFLYMSWQLNEEYRLVEVPRDAYDFVQYDREEVSTLEDLILHTEPNSSETFGISPQKVKFLQVSGDWRWVLLETADGIRGWFEVEDFIVLELNKPSSEVFENLHFAG